MATGQEFDLVSSWVHYVKESLVLHHPSIWESWVYAALWMPFPLAQLDALIKCRGYDLSLEVGTLQLCTVPLGSSAFPHCKLYNKLLSDPCKPHPDGLSLGKRNELKIIASLNKAQEL